MPPHLTVRISEATDLHTVLAVVCAQTQARRDLAAPAAAVPVGPTSAEGTWGAVVAKLMTGSGLSFTAVPPAAGHEAQLVVLGPSGPVAGTLGSAPDSAAASGSPSPDAGGAPGAARGSTLEMPSASPEDVARGSASMPGPPAAPPPVAADGGPQPSTSSGDASRAGTGQSEALGGSQAAGPAPAALPPAGALGTPLWAQIRPPAPRGTTMVLPFPDAQGNPIVVTIPTEPLKVFPFPGPDGQPVPIPPPQPGQKLIWPFPPPAGAPHP